MAQLRLLVVLACGLVCAGYSGERVTAAPQASRVEFENASLRVHQVSVGPGARASLPGAGVLVYLTADLDGRMPKADALWEAAGSPLENRAATRFDAIFVEVRVAAGAPSTLVPELAPGTARDSFGYESPYRREHRSVSLIDNDRVTVSLHRIVPLRWTEQFHFHPKDAVFVYLDGGEISGSNALAGYHYARRGEFDVLPANVFHTLYNGGNDPIDFVAIWPK